MKFKKNKRRIDPRYFMDEKTDIIKEGVGPDPFTAAGLDEAEKALVIAAIRDPNVEFYETSAFEKLFEYFAFETGEMPYGVAKARTGDPDVWVLEHLQALGY